MRMPFPLYVTLVLVFCFGSAYTILSIADTALHRVAVVCQEGC